MEQLKIDRRVFAVNICITNNSIISVNAHLDNALTGEELFYHRTQYCRG